MAQSPASPPKSTRLPYLLGGTHVFEHIYQGVLPPIFSLLRQEMGLSYAQLGFLVSARELIYGFLQFFMGYLGDRWGHDRLLVIGFCGMTTACLLLGLAPGYYWMVLFQFFSGIFGSTFHPTSFTLVADHSPAEKMGKNLALHGLGGMLGSAVVFGVIAALAAYLGWRHALVLAALPGFLMCLVLWRYLWSRPAFRETAETAASKTQSPAAPRVPLLPLLLITKLSFLMGICNRTLVVFLPTFLNVFYGFSVVQAGMITSFFFVTGFLGNYLGGFLTDRVNRINLIFWGSMGTALFIFLLCFTRFSEPIAVTLMAVLGIVRMLSFPARNAVATGVASQSSRGTVFGFVFGGGFSGGALATVVLGYLADLYGIAFSFKILALLAALAGISALSFKFIKTEYDTGS